MRDLKTLSVARDFRRYEITILVTTSWSGSVGVLFADRIDGWMNGCVTVDDPSIAFARKATRIVPPVWRALELVVPLISICTSAVHARVKSTKNLAFQSCRAHFVCIHHQKGPERRAN